MKNQKTLLCICLLFLCSLVYGQSIMVCINQQDGLQEKEQRVTIQFEDFLVESFFDKGFIVTTYPISVQEKDSLQNLLDECQFGSMDYLVYLTLTINPLTERITSIDWNCFSVMQEKKMNQSQFEVTHYEKNNEEKRLKVIIMRLTQ